jgi:hypothetical protein
MGGGVYLGAWLNACCTTEQRCSAQQSRPSSADGQQQQQQQQWQWRQQQQQQQQQQQHWDKSAVGVSLSCLHFAVVTGLFWC